jgi:hypothetical protein
MFLNDIPESGWPERIQTVESHFIFSQKNTAKIEKFKILSLNGTWLNWHLIAMVSNSQKIILKDSS